MTKLKKFEESLKLKETELIEKEKELKLREQNLMDREDEIKESEKKIIEKERRNSKEKKEKAYFSTVSNEKYDTRNFECYSNTDTKGFGSSMQNRKNSSASNFNDEAINNNNGNNFIQFNNNNSSNQTIQANQSNQTSQNNYHITSQSNNNHPNSQIQSTNNLNLYNNNNRINLETINNNMELFSERTKPSTESIMTSYKYNPDNFQTLQENTSSMNYFSPTNNSNSNSNNKDNFNISKGQALNKQSIEFNPYPNQNKFSNDYSQYTNISNAKDKETNSKITENYNFKFDPSLYKDREMISQHNSRINTLVSSGNESKKQTSFSVNNLTMKNMRPTTSKNLNPSTPGNSGNIHTPQRSVYINNNSINSNKTILTPQTETFSTVSSTPGVSNRTGHTSVSDNNKVHNKYNSILTKDRSASPSVHNLNNMNNYSTVNSSVKKSFKIPNK